MPLYLVPAIAAGLYAAGSLALKTSMTRGANARRVMWVSNLAMALWSLPLVFLFPKNWDLQAWLAAVAAGAALFGGRIFAIKALEVGDLSVVAPLLGLKTVLVAVLTLVFFPFQLSVWVIVSAVMATAGVVLLRRGPKTQGTATRKAAWLALGASCLFAVTDVLVQGSARTLGIGLFQPTLFFTVALLSPLLGRTPPPPAHAKRPLFWGAGIMGFQTPLVVLVIGYFGEAVVVNVIYSSRALWSVLADLRFGGAHVRKYMGSRLAGALLITTAVIVAIVSRL